MYDGIPEPYELYDRYCAEQERNRKHLPVCMECDNPIEDDYAWEYNDEMLCYDCLVRNHRKPIEDVMI